MNCKGNSIGSLIKAFSFQSTHTFLAFHYYLGPVFFFWLYKTRFFLFFLFFNHYLSEVNSAQPLIGQKSQQCSSWTVDGSRLENPGGKYSCQICPDQFDGRLTGPDGYMVNDYSVVTKRLHWHGECSAVKTSTPEGGLYWSKIWHKQRSTKIQWAYQFSKRKKNQIACQKGNYSSPMNKLTFCCILWGILRKKRTLWLLFNNSECWRLFVSPNFPWGWSILPDRCITRNLNQLYSREQSVDGQGQR